MTKSYWVETFTFLLHIGHANFKMPDKCKTACIHEISSDPSMNTNEGGSYLHIYIS